MQPAAWVLGWGAGWQWQQCDEDPRCCASIDTDLAREMINLARHIRACEEGGGGGSVHAKTQFLIWSQETTAGSRRGDASDGERYSREVFWC